ncbi:MAG: hypothetical protein ACQKBV_06835 [Puniceicoccales bacterium]
MNRLEVPFTDQQLTIISEWSKRYRVTPGQFCQAFALMNFEGLDGFISDIGETHYDTQVLDGITRYVDESAIPEWLANED